jgi:hypothetical protein
MANKRGKQKKAKQSPSKGTGQKGGTTSQEMSSPAPMKKRKK